MAHLTLAHRFPQSQKVLSTARNVGAVWSIAAVIAALNFCWVASTPRLSTRRKPKAQDKDQRLRAGASTGQGLGQYSSPTNSRPRI